MIIRNVLCIVSLWLLIPLGLFSQNITDRSLLNVTIENKADEYKNELNFYKAQLFYRKSNWDSVLIYSMKQLSGNTSKVLDDYCLFFRAFSFKNKKLLNESKKEFGKISDKFPFYYLVTINLGEIALEQSEFQVAIDYFSAFEKLPGKEAYDYNRSAFSHNLGLCYFHIKEFGKAEGYLLKSAVMQEKEKDTARLVGAYMDIANLYYEQYKDKMAIPYFEKAYQMSKKVNDFQVKQNAAQNMSAVEENRKRFPQALSYRKEYEQWKDSLNDQNKIWAVADVEKKFAVKEKEKEVTVLQTENKLKIAERNGFIFASLLLAAILLTSIYFYTQKSKRNKLLGAQKMQETEIAHQKHLLQSVITSQEAERKRIGMDLHDEVGAALSTLRIKIEQHAGEATTAPAVTENYKSDIDKIIANMRNISHALSPRIAGNFGFYDAIHELADGVNRSGTINMQIHFDENNLPVFANEQAPMALYRVITELVNNTLKHARAQNIQLTVALAGDTMSMAYSDDGIGITKNPGMQDRGMGMQNIESRLGIIGASWAVQEPENGGYGVAITVPLK
jgi:signal transduction histidine kinase